MLNLPELLAQLPGCPAVDDATPLEGSPVSRKWHIRSEIGALVLRADEPLAQQLGLNRQRELDALRAAGPLAPEVISAAPAQGLLLVRFVKGAVQGSAQLESSNCAGQLGAMLRDLHACRAPGCAVVDYAAAAARYAAIAGGAAAAALAGEVAELAGRWCADPDRYVLCHHDPGPGNVLRSPDAAELRLIDWEYAGRGEPFMDLAVLLCGPAGRAIDAVLAGYGNPVDGDRLEGCSALYRRLAVLWLMAVCSATDAPQAYYQALNELRAVL